MDLIADTSMTNLKGYEIDWCIHVDFIDSIECIVRMSDEGRLRRPSKEFSPGQKLNSKINI